MLLTLVYHYSYLAGLSLLSNTRKVYPGTFSVFLNTGSSLDTCLTKNLLGVQLAFFPQPSFPPKST